MSHIGNKLKSGFFATPLRQGEFIQQLIEVKGSCSFFDPTCGEGEVLHYLGSSLSSEDCSISTYGVELDKARAIKAQSVLGYCINAPIESMVIQNDIFSFLFLNPPYDFSMKAMDDDKADRKEWIELERNVRYLKDGGLIVYIIPSYRFADKKIARFLSTNFENIGVVRFSDHDYDDFKQCLFIANKKQGKHKELNEKLFEFLMKMEDEEFIKKQVTPINLLVGKHKWNIPSGATELRTFYTKLEEKSNYYEGIKNSKGFLAFKERTKPKQLEIGGNPCLPINSGQLALLLASGAINGEIGEGKDYHLVQGLEMVSKVKDEEIRQHDNGSKTIITKHRTKREVSVKIITQQGLIRKIV